MYAHRSLWEAAQQLIKSLDDIKAGGDDKDTLDHRHEGVDTREVRQNYSYETVFNEIAKFVNSHNDDADEKNNVAFLFVLK